MAESNEAQENDGNFQWDETSQLYYHASTGFYHDSQAGWYYSSRDGLYYKFEDGNYVLLEGNHVGDQSEMSNTNCQGESIETELQEKEVSVDPSIDSSAFDSNDQSEYPPPPSEWLEETLIDMYLSGYQNQTPCAAVSDMTMGFETNEMDTQGDEDIEELEEGEWIPDDPDFWKKMSERSLYEDPAGLSHEEENWHAQYGQVNQVYEEWMSDLEVVDLWDWALVRGTKKDGKTEVARVVGRLRKRSNKFHPAVPSGGGILKTAPVRETYLDLVRVSSGKVYRLKIPSLQYLAALGVYDASNPTKEWGFPQLSIKSNTKKSPKSDQQSESQSLELPCVQTDKTLSSTKVYTSKKDHAYRDRAAERRALHGGFGIGPGQKQQRLSGDESHSLPSSPSLQPEEAAAESMNISFGAGSYARKLMEGMGWKEGEALGSSMKGLTEPLQATGNKGTAGLGWNHNRTI